MDRLDNITRIGAINKNIMLEYAGQIKINKPPVSSNLPSGTPVKHKVFGEGMIESVDENTKTI